MRTPREPAGAAGQVRATLDGVQRRMTLRCVLRAVACGVGAVAVVFAVTIPASWTARSRAGAAAVAGAVASAGMVARTQRERTRRAAAAALERRYPSLRTLAVTAEELIAEPERTRPYMWNRVMQAAASALTGVDQGRVVPLARDTIAVAVAIVAATAVPFAGRPRMAASTRADRAPQAERSAVAGDILIDITPPAYTARPTAHLRNPVSVEALAGSVADIRVAGASRLDVRVDAAAIAPDGDAVHATLSQSGSIAIDAGAVHTLLPLTVAPDAAPDVRVIAPGKDLRLADAKATIPVRAAAADDIGLRGLELRYTIVSGRGEQFSFSEGTMPAAVAKDSARAWTATASLSLAALGLEPGDALIYRAVASDARRGPADESSSDTYFIEIAGPGDVPLEGVDMPPDRERYAFSEAMIVLKIQRLIAREAAMPRAEVVETAANIAAQQRAVRANFIFLLGGEVEDEVVEAETSHEIQEGR